MSARALPGWVVGLFCLALRGAPAGAQFEARIDLSSSSRYVWHGLSRGAGVLLQASVASGLRIDRLTVAGGLVRHLELDRPGPGELSELGSGKGRVGEDDLWAGADYDLGRLRVRSGVVRYLFRGEAPEGSRGPLRNTTEIYAMASATTKYFNPSIEGWWDAGAIHGAFLRVSGSSPVIGWPYDPFLFLALSGEFGVNPGPAPDAARPNDRTNFAGRGLTHAGLELNVSRRLRHWEGLGSATLDLRLNGQLNIDEATQFNGAGSPSRQSAWFSAGVTFLIGGEAKTLR